MTEHDKYRALYALFADYFVDDEKPLTSGRDDVLKAKVLHLLSVAHSAGLDPNQSHLGGQTLAS